MRPLRRDERLPLDGLPWPGMPPVASPRDILRVVDVFQRGIFHR